MFRSKKILRFNNKSAIKNVIRGAKAKEAGDDFESLITVLCSVQKITCKKIPNGMVGFGKSARRVRTPFDFITAKNKQVVLFDAKSTKKNSFSYSDLSEHQVRTLSEFEMSGITAGYIINFRTLNQVCFFNASILKAIKPRDSIKPSDGLILGSSNSFNIGALFND